MSSVFKNKFSPKFRRNYVNSRHFHLFVFELFKLQLCRKIQKYSLLDSVASDLLADIRNKEGAR